MGTRKVSSERATQIGFQSSRSVEEARVEEKGQFGEGMLAEDVQGTDLGFCLTWRFSE